MRRATVGGRWLGAVTMPWVGSLIVYADAQWRWGRPGPGEPGSGPDPPRSEVNTRDRACRRA